MNKDSFCNLRFGYRLAIAISNILLAVLLLLVCFFPFLLITWVLAFLYNLSDHTVVAVLVLAIWLWLICSAGIFIRVAVLALYKKRWSLTFQSLPFVGGGVLYLLAYFTGGLAIIKAFFELG